MDPDVPRSRNLSIRERVAKKTEGSVLDQCARAMLGEKFEQNSVTHASVKDDDGLDAAFDGFDAGFELGDHAARNRAVLHEGLRLTDGQDFHQLALLVEHSAYIGKEKEARRTPTAPAIAPAKVSALML